MAIRINNPNIPTDKNTASKSKLIGLKLPLSVGESEGYFESTNITLDAVKENLKNLLKTRKGERVFQTKLGIGLDDVLFENMTPELETVIRDRINSTIQKWLPFVGIKQLDIDMNDQNNANKLNISIQFYLNSLPNMFDSVTLEI
jgi:phage baseplate assembly protein W